MRRNAYTILISIFYFVGLPGQAQDGYIFTVEDFIQQVKQFHPVAKQASLITEKAGADLLSSKGAFDPVLEMNGANKSLDGINYYQYNNSELKIPTNTGVSFKAGYERSKGQFINPELTDGVASYLAVELPLLNGLLTDKKRTALLQARLYRQMSEQERLLMVNDLLLNAYVTYWEWAGAYQLYRVYSGYLQVADKRSRLVGLSFKNGDRAMADTIEAYTQFQNYRLLQEQALLDLNKKALDLSLYLWSQQEAPYLLPNGYVPDTTHLYSPVPLPDTSLLVTGLQAAHPLLQTGRYKGKILEAERKLKFQNLLPVVNLQANLLSKDYFLYKNFSFIYLQNNYKFGIQARVPLWLRQGRGEYKAVKLKIKENDLELARKAWELQTKVRKYYTEAVQLREQIKTATEMYVSYKALLKTEELKFAQGESSLFLINARENKLLEIQQKLIELQVKYQQSVHSIEWASGFIH